MVTVFFLSCYSHFFSFSLKASINFSWLYFRLRMIYLASLSSRVNQSIFFVLRCYYFFLLYQRNQVNFQFIALQQLSRSLRLINHSLINYKQIQLRKHKMQNKRRVNQLSSVQDPQKVKVLILTDQKTISTDFYFINRFTNIVKLDLSYNKLASFPVGFNFKSFGHLRTLFLHYNKFNSIKAVQSVSECEALEYLTLFGNPLEETKTRHFFINRVQSLKLMDDKIVRMEERNPQLILSIESEAIRLSFPIVTILQSEGSTFFLSAVISELRLIRQKYLQANPIVKIQRWYKKILAGRRKSKMIKQARILSQIPIQLQIQPVTAKTSREKERLVTQRLEIHVSGQEKILSLLQMNVEFLALLRQRSSKKVFALKSFCEENNLKYEETSNKLLCLRVPSSLNQVSGKNHLQFILKSSQRYLLRRRGSQASMNMSNRFKILGTLLRKKMKRQPSYLKEIQSLKNNPQLNAKMDGLFDLYCNRFVLVKEEPQKIYSLMKEQYFKSRNQKKIFPFCLEEIMERSAAAVSIQRIWRGYRARKIFGNAYEKMAKDKAARFIQRHIKNLGFRKRNTMLIELTEYIKRQEGSQIMIPMEEVLSLERRSNEIRKGINFAFPSQKVNFCFESNSQNIRIQANSSAQFHNRLKKIASFPFYNGEIGEGAKENNILDILFKGVKLVKYFQLPSSQNQSSEKLAISKSITTLGKSGVIVLKTKYSSKETLTMKSKVDSIDTKDKTKFVILEYLSNEEATNRKLLLALLTYKLISSSFVKSLKMNLKENSCAFKNVTEQSNECFLLAKLNRESSYEPEDSITYEQLRKREKSATMKIKFFAQQTDHTLKAQIYFPASFKVLKKEHSMSLPLRNISYATSIEDKSSIIEKKEAAQPMHTAHITRNILTIFPNELQSEKSEINAMSYREHDQSFRKKMKNRYEEIEESMKNKQRSLEKSQSLQPPSKNETSGTGYFPVLNKNLEKSYATEVHNQSVTQSLRNRPRNENSLGYYSIEDQKEMKKKKVILLKDTHRERLEENNRYKKEELTKLRERYSDEEESNIKIMQSNRLEGVMANARRHNMVKKALKSKLEDIKMFEKDFLKRGNSSIRRDLIKFQHDRSSKSPDNESIYDSLKSLEPEAIKNHLLKRSKNIFNLKTEIKQFSIDGSEGDPDLSLGALQMDSRSKELRKKICEQHSQANESETNQKQAIKRAKSQKKDLKKKKVVHSVFPQEFYPLKESKKLGFELPRINKK